MKGGSALGLFDLNLHVTTAPLLSCLINAIKRLRYVTWLQETISRDGTKDPSTYQSIISTFDPLRHLTRRAYGTERQCIQYSIQINQIPQNQNQPPAAAITSRKNFPFGKTFPLSPSLLPSSYYSLRFALLSLQCAS